MCGYIIQYWLWVCSGKLVSLCLGRLRRKWSISWSAYIACWKLIQSRVERRKSKANFLISVPRAHSFFLLFTTYINLTFLSIQGGELGEGEGALLASRVCLCSRERLSWCWWGCCGSNVRAFMHPHATPNPSFAAKTVFGVGSVWTT